jgi:Zn-dependent peptidase ImmA (M78 family)/transcriptional regulator with XRE-family HTH domain
VDRLTQHGHGSRLVLPERVRAARELRGFTQRQVVARMEGAISAPALSQIESGKLRPAAATVESLATALEVPPDFFSAQWPAQDAPVAYFRDLRSTSTRERRRAAAQALLLNDLVLALEQHVRLPDVDVPSCPIARGATSEEVEQAASLVRNTWGLGLDPIPHVVRELERHGVVVARLTLGHEAVDAFSTRLSQRPLVLLADDKSDNYVRSRFDGSHELGHLVMHEGAEPGERDVERQAQDFGSAFLFPAEVARKALPPRLDATGWARLAELKRTWGISIAALLYRGRKVRLYSADDYQSAMRYMSSRGWRRNEPGDREMGAPEAPLLLERSIRRALVEAGVPLEELVAEAHLPADDIVELVQAAVDLRPIIEL